MTAGKYPHLDKLKNFAQQLEAGQQNNDAMIGFSTAVDDVCNSAKSLYTKWDVHNESARQQGTPGSSVSFNRLSFDRPKEGQFGLWSELNNARAAFCAAAGRLLPYMDSNEAIPDEKRMEFIVLLHDAISQTTDRCGGELPGEFHSVMRPYRALFNAPGRDSFTLS